MPFAFLPALLLASAPAVAGVPPAPAADLAPALPAEFLHDRIWLLPHLNGEVLRFYTDTGGGWNAVNQVLASQRGWPPSLQQPADGPEIALVDFPEFDAGFAIPAPPRHFMFGNLMLAEPDQLLGGDGFLGGRWFADGIWDFDYPAKTLRRLATAPACATPVPLGFQTNARGERTLHFPSLTVTVDGEPLPMLFDTGATATLTPTSGPAFDLPPGTDIGTSFIEHTVFERWHATHPDWRVLDAADQKGDQSRRMIEVPGITIAGQTVGPVWFAEQPEGSFQSYMASMMDVPPWGALGGSGLRHFRVVLDYPAAQACFTRPQEP